MLSRILPFVVVVPPSIFVGLRAANDYIQLIKSPHDLDTHMNAIWNKFNPFYSYSLIKNNCISCGLICTPNKQNYWSVVHFNYLISKFCITPQLIYLMLNKGANCDILISKMYKVYKTENFWNKCMKINPIIYKHLPNEYRTNENTSLYMNSFKVGASFNSYLVPGDKRTEKRIEVGSSVLFGLQSFDKKEENDHFVYTFDGYDVKVNKDNLDTFWRNLLKSDHNARCLFPHAPITVQNEILKEIKDFKLHELEGFVLNGEQFNNLNISKETLVKNVNSTNIHFDLELKLGLNKDIKSFDPLCNCCAGGIYATDLEHQIVWKRSKVYQAEVPNDQM
jgi:hypothetical protein